MWKRKINWRNVLTVTAWSITGGLLVFLLVAAGNDHRNRVCKGVAVEIKTSGDAQYIEEKDILWALTKGRRTELEGVSIYKLDLKKKELLLERNLWIRKADLFVDHLDSLRVIIEQRRPVARLYCQNGQTFYIDDQGMRLPFSFNQIAAVPVFTSLPEISDVLTTEDSVLLTQIRDMGTYMINQPFWMAQIEQIDLQGKDMVLIPKLGKHEILFGEGIQIEQKFKRLMLFYEQIMKKTGWNYYSHLDLRFNKLLIGTRRDSASLFASFVIPKDTILINSLLDSARISNDTSLKLTTSLPVDSISKQKNQIKNINNIQQPDQKKPADIKKTMNKTNDGNRQPKALMAMPLKKDSINNKQHP
jgi:cell division protein FtsQ